MRNDVLDTGVKGRSERAAPTAPPMETSGACGQAPGTYTKKNRVQTWSVLGTTQISPCLCRSGEVITESPRQKERVLSSETEKQKYARH